MSACCKDAIDVSKLRRRVSIQTYTSTFTKGVESRSFSTLASAWCSIDALSGRELEASQALTADVQFKIEMRYLSTVKPKMRVIYGARQFEILAVLNDENSHVWTRLMVKELNG